MGCGISKEEDKKVTPGGQGDISDALRDIPRRPQTVLLLGPPGSGKSTLLKQLRILHTDGYTIAERQSFRTCIFSNTIQSMRTILEHMDSPYFTSDDPTVDSYVQTILGQPAEVQGDIFPSAVSSALVALLDHDVIQESLTRSIGHKLTPGYVPNHHDILRSYAKTTDITEATFFQYSMAYRMIEIPHSQSIQQTMGSCENVTAIIFFADLSTYDQLTLPSSDEADTSLQDALLLFGTLFNSPSLSRTKFILFLNKADIFKEKLLVTPLNHHFPDYSGGDDFREALTYIVDRFANIGHDGTKQVYAHITCSLDTTQMRFIMAACNGGLYLASYTLTSLISLPDILQPQCNLGSRGL
ncbi:Fc.00g097910.m01.CDS01 [Cosmosporella sp. VM-42]